VFSDPNSDAAKEIDRLKDEVLKVIRHGA